MVFRAFFFYWVWGGSSQFFLVLPAPPPPCAGPGSGCSLRYLRRRTAGFSCLSNFALPTASSAQSRGATRAPSSRITWYRAIYVSVCYLLFIFCFVLVLLVPAKHSSPSRSCRWCHLPFRVFVVSSSNRRHANGPREVFGVTSFLY